MVVASGTLLMDLPGVGPVVAARTLADVGDVARFADRNRFASWTGTAPIEASSGEIVRHRLSRAGNRRMNHMIHIAAATQIRLDTPGRAYYRRKLAAGKTRAEAMRCLKRRISDALYRQLLADARDLRTSGVDAGPGGHCGASLKSSAAGLHPHTDTSLCVGEPVRFGSPLEGRDGSSRVRMLAWVGLTPRHFRRRLRVAVLHPTCRPAQLTIHVWPGGPSCPDRGLTRSR
jgi:hypothetical protein